MDLSLVDGGGLFVVRLWGTPAARCWIFRFLFLLEFCGMRLPPDVGCFAVCLALEWGRGWVGLPSGDGDGMKSWNGYGDGLRYPLNMLFSLVILHTVAFQSPMYMLYWFGIGCVAK